jgi:hypothetical protein
VVEASDDIFPGFATWVDAALATHPAGAAAFCFNLYEYEDAYRVEIVATSRSDRDDPEWAVDPIFFMPKDYLFPLERQAGDDDWQRALAQAQDLIRRYLQRGDHSEVLRKSRGVGCGFVDGDIHVLWPVT